MKDETYHGTLIQGKTKRISYKNHTSIATPKEQWYVQENILPKILDDQTWIAIQNKLQLHPRASKNGKHPIFTGKVFCGVCGKPLQKNSSSSLASPVKKEYLICKARKEHWKNCENKKSFPVLELQKLIITQFQNLWNSYYDMTTLKQIHKEEPHHQTIDDLMKEEQNLQEIIQQNNQILYQLYKDKSTGLMDDSCFHTLLLQNQQEMDTYHQRLQMIAQELKQIQTKQEFFMSTVCEFLNTHSFEDYFSTILQHFISSIFIGKLNHHQRTIQIHWKI